MLSSWSWLWAVSLAGHSLQASVLGERSLKALQADDLSPLLTTPDPVKAIDFTNPSSHLSKILIPRARR